MKPTITGTHPRRARSDKTKAYHSRSTFPAEVELPGGNDAKCTCDFQKLHSSSDNDLEDYDGRIPTDELRKKGQSKVRHHLDRTTPLLVSPPKQSSPLLHTREKDLLGGEDDRETRKCSSEVLGAGGRDMPRHISGRSSPFHADCVPECDRRSTPVVRPRSPTPPAPLKTSQVSKPSGDPKRKTLTTQSGDRMWVTRPGTDSCNVCGSSLQPAALQSRDRSRTEPLGGVLGSKQAKGKDYKVPVTVAAQPCGAYGRMCDKQSDHYVTHQSIRSQQQQSQQQLKKIRSNLKIVEQPPVKHITGQIHGGHTHTMKPYEPSSYRGTPDKEADQLSLSPLSMSSCSVASDILEKARKRRDHFWAEGRQPSE